MADPNSAAYKKHGAGGARLDNKIATAKEKRPGEVQEKLKVDKASDGDVSEYDRRMDAIASMPDRMPTRPGQASSGRRPSAAPKVAQAPKTSGSAASEEPQKEKTASEYSRDADEMRNLTRQKAAVVAFPSTVYDADTDRMKNKSRRQARFEGSKRMAQTPEAQAKRKAMEKSQALERVTPEKALIGGAFGLKALHAAAKNLAGTGAKTTAKAASTGAKSPLRQKTEQLIKEDKNPGRSVSPAPASPKVSLKEKTKELIQSDRTAKTKELSSKMAEKQTPTKFASKKSTSAGKPLASKRTKKFNEDESGMDFKRGGSVSSASKRADGCAQRGKTRA